MDNNQEVGLSIEIDSFLYQEIQNFIKNNPKWDKSSLITASLSLFFMQNPDHISFESRTSCGRAYLEAVCNNFEQVNIF